MKRYIAVSIISSTLTTLLVVSISQTPPEPAALGQERVPFLPRVDIVEDAGQPGQPLPQGLTAEEHVNIAVYERVNRSVVHITTRSARADAFFFMETPVEGSGSGSVLDRQGHILTNYHVIENAREVRVTLFDGETYDAGLVGIDPVNDMAILQISAPAGSLFPVGFGESSDLKVGQKVFAIGNPFGLDRTMTTGIISSLNRSLPIRSDRTMKSIIQIDAALNRGNSGGPLLNSQGQLIGMNTAIASQTGENTGIGFAIPINTIRRIAPQLIENGRVIRPTIGITQAYETDQGLLVVALSPGGPAERAGLKGFKVIREQRRRGALIYERTRVDRSEADLIIAVNGKPAKTKDEFLSQVESHQPGDQITLTIIREGRRADIPVTLGASD